MSPSVVMWTTALSEGAVNVDLSNGKASLHAKDILVFDGFTVPNALNPFHPGGHVNSIINSLRMEWNATVPRSWTDCVDAFRGDFIEGSATIEVTATTPPTPASTCPARPARNGFRFVSDPASTTISLFAQIGRERNGIFFNGSAPGDDD
jgi:hypothetical protein